jgi:hypothetical protein
VDHRLPRYQSASRALIAIAAMLPLAAGCGDHTKDRIVGATLMGAGLGIPGGPIGIAVGAGVGAAAGATIPAKALEGNSQAESQSK